MKQIYEDLSDNTDFDIIDLDDIPDRDTVKRRKKKSQRDVNKTNKSEEVKKEGHSFTEDPSEDSRKKRCEKDRADRCKSNQQTPADRSPWRNASDDRRNCIYYFQEFLEQLSGIRFTCHSGKCQELYARCLPWLRSISADYGDYFLPMGADRTLRLWRQGNKACRYRTGAFLLPVHRCNCSCCRNVLESDSFFSITTDWSCRWSAAVWRSERNPSSIMWSWTRKLYCTENIFLEHEKCQSRFTPVLAFLLWILRILFYYFTNAFTFS